MSPENILADPMTALEKILLGAMLAVIMCGMGAGIDPADVLGELRRPRGVLIGLFSQFLLMPLIALGLAWSLNLPAPAAIGLVLIGCMPGGSTSNMFSYFARGDVALSVTMTTVSTLLATVLMPITLGLASRPFVADVSASYGDFVIPYAAIVGTLMLVLLPVAGGMLWRRISPAWARVAEETAGFVGFLVILFLMLSWLLRADNRMLMWMTPLRLYLAVLAVGFAGFVFGMMGAKVCRCPPRAQRAIALETGIQNTPLAIAILMVSFSGPLLGQLLWVPVLYALFIVISSSVVTLYLRSRGFEDWAYWKNMKVQSRLLSSQDME